MHFYDKVIETIERENMLKSGDTVVVGVSGGADSMCLLHTLMFIKDRYSLTLKVCHVNHKIRKETAERDANFVKAFCEKNAIPFFLCEVDVPKMAKELKVSDEEAGRIARYDFFQSVAGKDGKIATAHNKNDNVETVLMRMIRGTGLNGLAGIPYVRGNIIRPLLDISRDEIERYLADVHLNHITDETNLETDYTRNKIRLELIPYIQRTFNPSVIDTIGNNIRSYAEDSKYIEDKASVDVEDSLDIEALKGTPNAIRTRQIISFLKKYAGYESVSTNLVDDVVGMLDKSNKSQMSLKDNQVFEIRNGKLYVARVYVEDVNIVIETKDKMLSIPTLENVIKVSIVESKTCVVNSSTVVYIPFDKVGKLTLRKVQNGDKFLTCDKDGFHKKASKLSNREDFVLLNNDDVIWILNKVAWNLTNKSRVGKFVKLEIM